MDDGIKVVGGRVIESIETFRDCSIWAEQFLRDGFPALHLSADDDLPLKGDHHLLHRLIEATVVFDSWEGQIVEADIGAWAVATSAPGIQFSHVIENEFLVKFQNLHCSEPIVCPTAHGIASKLLTLIGLTIDEVGSKDAVEIFKKSDPDANELVRLCARMFRERHLLLRNVRVNPVKINPLDPFVPTPLQKNILAALDGKALKVNDLAHACSVERSRFYKPHGLRELQSRGMVCHKDQVGYFRPDSLPQ